MYCQMPASLQKARGAIFTTLYRSFHCTMDTCLRVSDWSRCSAVAQAVLSSAVPVVSTALPPSHPHIKAGTLIGLAVTGAKRWGDLPDVPTMGEAGFPDFIHETVNMMWAPAKTPPAIVERLVKEMLGIVQRPAVREALQKGGYEVLGGDSAKAHARVVKEVPMWRDVVAQTGIRLK